MLNRLLLVLGLCALLMACGNEHGADSATAGASAGGAAGGGAAGANVDDGGTSSTQGGAAGSDAGDAAPNQMDASATTDASSDAQAFVDGSTVLPHPYRALQVTVGALHACALLEDHRVKCWGINDIGELGYGDKKNRGMQLDEMGDALPFVELGTGRTASAIAAGRYTTCAILDDETVKCWGYNEGYDSSGTDYGDNPGEMGDQLPRVDLGVGRKATHIALKEYRGCIALDNGTARCWGMLQDTYDFHPTAPVRQMVPGPNGVLILLEDGALIRLPENTSETLAGATAIGGSPAGWCAVGAPGGLSCSPQELGGSQLGAMDLIGVGIGDLGSPFLCTLGSDGEVSCWGSDFDLGDCAANSPGRPFWCGSDGHTVDLGQPATSITTNSRGFECALLEDGAVKCWGNDDISFGVLGASVETTTDGGASSHVWHPIDLGTMR